MGYEFAKRLNLPMAPLENKAGKFVRAERENGPDRSRRYGLGEMPENLRLFIADPKGAESYPIVTYSWLLLYGDYDRTRNSERRSRTS